MRSASPGSMFGEWRELNCWWLIAIPSLIIYMFILTGFQTVSGQTFFVEVP